MSPRRRLHVSSSVHHQDVPRTHTFNCLPHCASIWRNTTTATAKVTRTRDTTETTQRATAGNDNVREANTLSHATLETASQLPRRSDVRCPRADCRTGVYLFYAPQCNSTQCNATNTNTTTQPHNHKCTYKYKTMHVSTNDER